MNDGRKFSTDHFTHYALGRISQELENLARLADIPPLELARGVATLLLDYPVRSTPGIENRVPTLSGEMPERNQTLEPLAMARGSRVKAPRARAQRVLSASARARIGEAQRKRWREYKRTRRSISTAARARSGWPSSKKARSLEMKRRRDVAAAKKKAGEHAAA